MKFFTAVVAAIALATSVSAAFSSCSSSTDDSQLSTVSYASQPSQGRPERLHHLKGALKKEITQGASIRTTAIFYHRGQRRPRICGFVHSCSIANNVNSATAVSRLPSKPIPLTAGTAFNIP
ncbi:MAG: hypothetical protein J3Q66DRAFT_113190 [Benniella sp.]|nr:MAG: hypothetical protein J3Q66DRAFT_113190 [Benniella sp.]